jgi:hypothetical protein
VGRRGGDIIGQVDVFRFKIVLPVQYIGYMVRNYMVRIIFKFRNREAYWTF